MQGLQCKYMNYLRIQQISQWFLQIGLFHPIQKMFRIHICVPHILYIDCLLLHIISIDEFNLLLDMNVSKNRILVLQQRLMGSRFRKPTNSINFFIGFLYEF